MNPKQSTLFDKYRMTLPDAIHTSIASLNAYAANYNAWSIAYSGGKDSSTTVSFVLWAIKNGYVQQPDHLIVLYADTRQELPPLAGIAHHLISDLQSEGMDARIVLPALDDRFYVYMLGRGVPPPSNTFRWCTARIKIKPMANALLSVSHELSRENYLQAYLYRRYGLNDIAKQFDQRTKFIQITGVRLGESAQRDARIAISCNSTKGECGQGWFQEMSNAAISDTLAPLLHWRSCFVWDWLTFGHDDRWAQTQGFKTGHGFDYLRDIAAAYGDDDARTGCMGCKLASRDVALEYVVSKQPQYIPLLEIRSVLDELKKPHRRIRKASPEKTKAGHYAKNGQRMGPLTMEARAWGLSRILDIQQRAKVDLINPTEEARIRELWMLGTWPDGWEGGEDSPNHIRADIAIDQIAVIGDDELVVQPLLI
jgi:DNA sulfur modification protein DndC